MHSAKLIIIFATSKFPQMIYVRDKGQMCNNILQFAHVWAFARHHGHRAISMRFAYKYPWFKICQSSGHNFPRYVAAKIAAARGWMPVVSYDVPGEISSEKENLILTARNVMVQGWEVRFYDLFLKYFDEIREMFAFLPGIEHAVIPLLKGKEQNLKLGLHVRRGDYSRWHEGRYFYSDEEYALVTASFARLHPKRKLTIFICGNDPAINPEAFHRAVPDAEIILAKGNPAEDLCLLSKCDAIAGPPSTFSLVASMYREIPLCWIENPKEELNEDSFSTFRTLFRHIK